MRILLIVSILIIALIFVVSNETTIPKKAIDLYINNENDAKLIETDNILLYESPLISGKFKRCESRMTNHLKQTRLFVKKTENESSLFIIGNDMKVFLDTQTDLSQSIQYSNLNLMELDQNKFKDLKFLELPMKNGQAINIPSGFFVFLEDSNDFAFKYV